MVKRVRILTIIFDSEIKVWEIPALRGAIVEKVGKENIIFHNHLKTDAYLYRYPLIQYKNIRGKPAMVCIDYGVDEIHKFFDKPDWSVKIGDRWLDMKVYKLLLNQFNMQVWESMFHYHIRNWVALNQENYKKYQTIESEKERIEFLERTLIGNIIAFAKGIEWDIEKQIKLSITSPVRNTVVSLKGKKVLGFNIDFITNVFLPNYIGLGKSVSLGFGMVKQINKKEN
ncbi:MAG: CRISPR-associated endonuclease Cas6 [Bacteroidales bacterium]|nr:CRISPR-associated endonuclease Cas6 [Bacteroidales bacterium]